MQGLFHGVYEGKRVLLTGHTGFKGSWLAFWLLRMGAQVTGVSLPPETEPNHYSLLMFSDSEIHSKVLDICDMPALQKVIHAVQPEIVFHLAAQPLVRRSYREPRQTFNTNVMGVVNLLEACRLVGSVKAIVNITSDKCYENREWVWGYRENDPMGGHDPYSASKGCSELLTASWRNSFFPPANYGITHQTLLASARAGNVIGGGDWGEDRLIPDIVRAIDKGVQVDIRNPQATRPWQHVLEPLSGYLLLGQKLLERQKDFAQAWNFGPAGEGAVTVGEVVQHIKKHWDKFDYSLKPDPDQPHEANLLRLDCSMARDRLGWKPVWDADTTFDKTISWYRAFYEQGVILTLDDLQQFIYKAQQRRLCWATL
jgi:CDP-glucose 4,6-dehydratase